jgi:hypothetical protein
MEALDRLELHPDAGSPHAGGSARGCRRSRRARDVSEDIANDLLDRAYDADEMFTEAIKRFIDRHVTPGEKRPPAPSVWRGQDQADRKKA